jgi:PAS domain S-box-containing protein
MNKMQLSPDQLLEIIQNGLNEAEKALMITEYEPLNEPGPRTLFVNDVFSKMTGFSKDESLGLSPRIHQGPETDTDEKHRIKHLLSKNENVSSTLINYRKDGTRYWTKLQISTAACGKKKYRIGIKKDITAEKEKEINLINCNTRLQSEILTVRKMISLIAHDMRSPLSGITGGLKYLSDCNDQVTENERESFLEVMISASDSIQNMLDSVLDWAVIQGNRLDCKPEPFDLNALSNSITEIYSIASSLKKIAIINEVTPAFTIHADKNMIHSVLRNLVSNSLKNTSSGGKIIISAEKMPSSRVIRVTDTGAGFGGPESTIQLDDETIDLMNVNKRKGLGLVLCRDFVKCHGGMITISTKPDAGMTVSINLPCDIELNQDNYN